MSLLKRLRKSRQKETTGQRRNLESKSNLQGNDDSAVGGETKRTEVSMEEIILFTQEQMSIDSTVNGELMAPGVKQGILQMAMSRDLDAIGKAKEIIYSIIDASGYIVEGYTLRGLTEEIFAKVWGLSVVEEFAMDGITDEIRVNSDDKIVVVQKGVPRRLDRKFKPGEVEIIIKRLVIGDMGSSIDESEPRLEAVTRDGSRLTAFCPPVTSNWKFVLRRPISFQPTTENYIQNGTFNAVVWDIISALAGGRASILFSGNVGAGKTTLLRKAAGELNDKIRIGVIGKDSELLLENQYPNKDIIELEEQPHTGSTMKELFISMLRAGPDVIMIEEFRGAGEAIEAIRACTRGMDGSMATAHFSTPQEAVEGTALFLLEEGLTLPFDKARLRVARAFNIVVQLAGDSVTGKKKVTEITELVVGDDSLVHYNTLVRWEPAGDDYYGKGEWQLVGKPSDKLLERLTKNMPTDALEKLGWV